MLGTAAALGIGAALGAAKYVSDAGSASRQRQLQGQIARYSPWTGLKPSPVSDPNPFGDVLTGAAGVGMLNQGLKGATAAPQDLTTDSTALAGGQGAFDPSKYNLLSSSQMAGLGGSSDLADPSMMSSAQNPWLNPNLLAMGQQAK